MIAHHEAGHLIVAADLGVMIDEVSVEVARAFRSAPYSSSPKDGGHPSLPWTTILGAGGEAERKFTGAEPRGIEADEAQLAAIPARTEGSGRVRARKMVQRLWPYIEELAKVLADPDNAFRSERRPCSSPPGPSMAPRRLGPG